MARKANPTVIGGFVVGAVVLAVAGLFVFGTGRFFADTLTYVLYFDGSIKGLHVGAPVMFRGVQIGSVADIKLVADVEDLSVRIPVLIEIDREVFTRMRGGVEVEEFAKEDPKELMDLLIERGLRAQLEVRSFVTGMLAVTLDFHPDLDEPAQLVGADSRYPEIPTIPSSMEELSRTVENLPLDELVQGVLETVQAIERLANAPELAASIRSADATLQDIRVLVQNANRDLTSLAENVERAVQDVRQLVQRVDGHVDPIASTMEVAVRDAGKLIGNFDEQVRPVTLEIVKTAETARVALEEAKRAIATAGDAAGEGSALREELTRALGELSAAARAIRILADQLERQPESLIRGKGGK